MLNSVCFWTTKNQLVCIKFTAVFYTSQIITLSFNSQILATCLPPILWSFSWWNWVSQFHSVFFHSAELLKISGTSFLWVSGPSCQPINGVKVLKETQSTDSNLAWPHPFSSTTCQHRKLHSKTQDTWPLTITLATVDLIFKILLLLIPKEIWYIHIRFSPIIGAFLHYCDTQKFQVCQF